jgi:hypothetical protein
MNQLQPNRRKFNAPGSLLHRRRTVDQPVKNSFSPNCVVAVLAKTYKPRAFIVQTISPTQPASDWIAAT